MVECSRIKYSEIEPSGAMVGCNRVGYNLKPK